MSPATNWTELSAAETGWAEGFTVPGGGGDAFVLFGILIPETGVAQFVDATTTYMELSIAATPSTELTGVLTTYTELTL